MHSDASPQFSGREFRLLSTVWKFHHVISSPGHAQSNGKAESAVKIIKRILRRSDDPMLALLEIRNTPTESIGASPVQIIMGRRTRDAVKIYTV